MGQLIKGKLIAQEIRAKVADRVAILKEKGITPKLAVILVGEDKPSQTYVRKKGQAAEKTGMDFDLYELPSDIGQNEIEIKINEIQSDPDLSGLIVQLPLPVHLDTKKIINLVKPELDVDCLTDINLGKLVMKTNTIVPPTPGAVMSIIHSLDLYDLVGKNVTIIGVGALVGKPLAVMMMNERASVTTCNSKTKDTKEKCLAADIIVTGVGRKDILRGDMVNEGTIVVDTGVSFTDGKMHGDVNIEEVLEKAAHVTPTPGGVGPITVARLLMNTAICAENKRDADLRMGFESTDNANLQINSENTLIYKDLSYEINGILFKVHNELGRYVNEKQICDKIEHYLKEKKIPYQREYTLPQSFDGEMKGRNRVDFIIDNKIILEIKCIRFIDKNAYFQTQRYLHALNLKLGIIANFRDDRLKPKRILNSQTKN